MREIFSLPSIASSIYPNPVQYVHGSPAIVFRDHRWVIPIIYHAAELGVIELPARVITFDRHRDALIPEDIQRVLPRLRSSPYTIRQLINCVKYHLSPRDDDWIVAGMELGLISDVFQFGSVCDENDMTECFTDYEDSAGIRHRIFHIERPSHALSYKGALSDSGHDSVAAGLWNSMKWDPVKNVIGSQDGGFVFDIDLDFFTISWETYTIPFTTELYEGEFMRPSRSQYHDGYLPADFVRELASKARIVTIATEPQFCDGAVKAGAILNNCNRYLFGGMLDTGDVQVDYLPDYPCE